jgi:hypothetical protein
MKKITCIMGLALGLAVVLHVRSATSTRKADLVVFSYDRPLQLYAFLESTKKYVSGIGQLSVIYRASSQAFNDGYEVVRADFPQAMFYLQGSNPAQDFKPLTLKALFESPAPYILFAVDDIVVKDTVDVGRCIDALETYEAYAFFLRLGKNLNYCYAMNQAQPVPHLKKEEEDIFSWQFSQSLLDWRYPHTVDLTLYRKKDIEGAFKTLSYATPNKLEGAWSNQAGRVLARKGLCFASSKMVNLPLNRVQHDYQNRAMSISPQELLAQFNAGKKMDSAQLHCIDNKSAHMEYVPTFVDRS